MSHFEIYYKTNIKVYGNACLCHAPTCTVWNYTRHDGALSCVIVELSCVIHCLCTDAMS